MNCRIIDFHTHAFPDFLAERAVTQLAEHSAPYKPHINGTISDLIRTMDNCGVNVSLIANIATKKEQLSSIIKWSNEIKSERIRPLLSFYPDKDSFDDLTTIKMSGFSGVKLHPMYQNFSIDEKKMFPIYDYLSQNNIFILFHAGFDIAFPGDYRASPDKISVVLKNFPNLTVIASHVGGWQDWESVFDNIIGKSVYIETSFINEVEESILYKILSKHDSNRFLFGSDSPWLYQKEQLDYINRLDISDNFKEKIQYLNGELFLEKFMI